MRKQSKRDGQQGEAKGGRPGGGRSGRRRSGGQKPNQGNAQAGSADAKAPAAEEDAFGGGIMDAVAADEDRNTGGDRRPARNRPAAAPKKAAEKKPVAEKKSSVDAKPVEKKSKPAAERKPARRGERTPAKRVEVADDSNRGEKGEKKEPKPERSKPDKPIATDGGFGGLGLSDTTLGALVKAEYQEPTPVQAGLIPVAITGVDVMGQAQTGTGKTAAFVIPILERLETRKRGGGSQALVLVPTRELAVQVHGEFEKLAEGRRFHSVAVYGGKPIRGQIEKLSRGIDVVVGTPGRVLDHIGRGSLVLADIRMVVLDEADRMLDIGFRPDIEKILRRCPRSRQTLLLSATIPPPVERLARRYMESPESLNFSPKEVSVDTIEQRYFTVNNDQKTSLLVKLIEREDPAQSIIFCRTKRGCDRLANRLTKKFRGVDCIHGDLAQNVRDRVMKAFRDGKVKHLVATDVVGRGIDVSGVSHIFNNDIPAFCDDYVHRVGRTGRMGREGIAFTFVTPDEGNELTRIEMRINRVLERDEIEGFSSVATAKPTGTVAEQEAQAEEEKKDKPKAFNSRRRRHKRGL